MSENDADKLQEWLGSRWTRSVAGYVFAGFVTVAGFAWTASRVTAKTEEILQSVRPLREDFEKYRSANDSRVQRIEIDLKKLSAEIHYEKP